MSIEKLERVMWRLRSKDNNRDTFTNDELKKAIMQEIGTDPRTYNTNREALKKLKWIKTKGRKKITLTNKDL